MKGYEINGALYVFESEATAIQAATSVQAIYVETKYVDAFKEANATAVAEMIQGYNFNTMTVNAKPFAGHEDDDYPPSEPTEEPTEAPKTDPDLAWSATSATATINVSNWPEDFPTLTNTDEVDVTYSSSNMITASVSDGSPTWGGAPTGCVILLGTGTTTISAAFAGNDEYNAKTVSYDLTVE